MLHDPEAKERAPQSVSTTSTSAGKLCPSNVRKTCTWTRRRGTEGKRGKRSEATQPSERRDDGLCKEPRRGKCAAHRRGTLRGAHTLLALLDSPDSQAAYCTRDACWLL